jgi:hypothetical protein
MKNNHLFTVANEIGFPLKLTAKDSASLAKQGYLRALPEEARYLQGL